MWDDQNVCKVFELQLSSALSSLLAVQTISPTSRLLRFNSHGMHWDLQHWWTLELFCRW